MDEPTISIDKVISGLSEPWQPRDLVLANDTVVREARFKRRLTDSIETALHLDGELPWHAHEEDELFLCWDGTFRVQGESRQPVILDPGDPVRRPTAQQTPPPSPNITRADDRTPETKQYGN